MTRCPKCSRSEISGPHYEACAGVEKLRYRCVTCGYTTTTPTHDTEEHNKAVARQLPDQPIRA